MELAFHTEELRDICIDESIADQRLGSRVGAALRNRLGDLRAADSVLELVTGRRHADRHDGKDRFRLELIDGVWMTFVPNHSKPRTQEDGDTDWGRIRRVRVIDIGD